MFFIMKVVHDNDLSYKIIKLTYLNQIFIYFRSWQFPDIYFNISLIFFYNAMQMKILRKIYSACGSSQQHKTMLGSHPVSTGSLKLNS